MAARSSGYLLDSRLVALDPSCDHVVNFAISGCILQFINRDGYMDQWQERPPIDHALYGRPNLIRILSESIRLYRPIN